MENSYHQTTRRNFLNKLGLAAAGMTTGNTALAATQYDPAFPEIPYQIELPIIPPKE